MKEDEQKKYLEFKMLEQQLLQTQKQLQLLEEQFIEIVYGRQSLDELRSVKPGSEILVPVASGVFAKATLVDSDEFVVNVGAGTAVPKSIDSTQKMFENQLLEVEKLKEQLTRLASQLEQALLERQKDLSPGA